MDIDALWQKALKQTELVRLRALDLATFETTMLPYIFLGESSVNAGDTVVRRGQVLVDRPALILPSAQLEGFAFESDWQVREEAVLNFLLVRGVRFPSMRYRHELSSLDVREESLQTAITHFTEQLKSAEDLSTGLVVGPEEAWQFSVLILVASLVSRSAEHDLRRLLDEWHRRREESR